MPRRQTLTRADLAHAQSWVVPPGQYDPDRAILGISTDATVVHVVLADPPGGPGYAWEVVGTSTADLYARSRSLWIDAVHPEDTAPAIEIHVRAYRVYTPQREVYVEACQLPDAAGVTLRVHQPPIMTLDEDTAARQALPHAWRLLRTLDQRGRRKGTGTYADRDTFLNDLTHAVRQVMPTGRYPSYRSVARHVGRTGLSPRHVQRLFSLHVTHPTGMTWRAFIASQ